MIELGRRTAALHPIAFRDTDGKVGIIDALCPHRQAPMYYGRNEEHGLRCIYHGWKISAAGLVTEAPTHPEHFPLERLKSRSHPVQVRQDMVWTWLGKGTPPPFRELAFTTLPHDQVITATIHATQATSQRLLRQDF